MTRTHELKTWPLYFEAVVDGRKTFEARFDDREFEVGDLLHLLEWNPDTREYTGRDTRRIVSYKLNSGEFVREGYCILGLRSVAAPASPPRVPPTGLAVSVGDIHAAVDEYAYRYADARDLRGHEHHSASVDARVKLNKLIAALVSQSPLVPTPEVVEAAINAYRDVVMEGEAPMSDETYRDWSNRYTSLRAALRALYVPPSDPLRPVHWRRWVVLSPEGEPRRLCLTEGDACETACGDEDVQEVAVYPVDATPVPPSVRAEDIEAVENFLTSHCDGSPSCPVPHSQLERIVAALTPRPDPTPETRDNG